MTSQVRTLRRLVSRSRLGMLASAYTLLTCLLPAALAFSPGFPYGTQKVRGVSLGGWLVIEVRMPSSFPFLCPSCALCVSTRLSLCRYLQPWITPSLFDNTGNLNIVDEWTFGQLQDRTTAQQKLKAHWDTWVTEADFAAIAAAGYVWQVHLFLRR